MKFKTYVITSCVALLVAAAVAPVLRAKDEKLKAEQVIAKSLEAIGPMDKLKEIKTRLSKGATHVEFKVGGSANLTGEGGLISDGHSVRLSLKFPSNQYPGEQFAFNGTDALIGQVQPGIRSPLGTFVFENSELLKQGLLFGELSTAWVLLDSSKLKVDLSGPKKVDGKSVYELKYIPRRGGIITAYFDFDSETFRHTRSQFKAEVAPTDNGLKITDTAETTRYTITEQFGDFKQVDGLTLPHDYKLEYAIDSAKGGFVANWEYVIEQMVHNQPIERQMFSGN
jgi:hypothetical protein